MPEPFRDLNLQQFAALVKAFKFTRRIESVHLHHTWRPNHAEYAKRDSIVAMWRYHTLVNGWSDIAQHVSIGPEGTIWTGRNWNQAPASSKGFNGTSATGPFMIEMIGDFDVGKDILEEKQLESALAVVAEMQRHFGLPPQALRFHNEMTDAKTCPGTQLDRDTIVRLVAAKHAQLASDASRSAEAESPFDPDQSYIWSLAESLARGNPTPGIPENDAEPNEELSSDYERSILSNSRPVVVSDRSAQSVSRSPGFDLSQARPYFVNLRRGMFSSDGGVKTSPADVDAIFGNHLKEFVTNARAAGRDPHLMLFAHGGLVSEAEGLGIALKQFQWWLDNGVYPLFFIWETGLMETLTDMISAMIRKKLGIERDIVARGLIPEKYWNRLIEAAARAVQLRDVWGKMKDSARASVTANGGARYVINGLEKFIADNSSADHPLRLHAVGHSAGSIFHSYTIPAATKAGMEFDTLQLLAPAIRADEFKQRLQPQLEATGVHACTMFTMLDFFEERDVCAIPLLQDYGRSLLKLIYYSLEDVQRTPILGLETVLRDDPALSSLFRIGSAPGRHEIIWSKSNSSTGRSASQATSHGGFDNDRATMESVMRRVIGRDEIVPFPEGAMRSLTIDLHDEETEEFNFLIEGLNFAASSNNAGPTQGIPAASPAASIDRPSQATQSSSLQNAQAGARRALCVGIDEYGGANTLHGCVADARQWGASLASVGFEVTSLENANASRDGIVTALRSLISQAKAGDIVVFNYAGHGTEVPDENGDEVGGNNGRKDEAICPVDFASGKLLIDDDIGAIFKTAGSGVNITCFFDCCHSGSITRFAIGGPPDPATEDRKARYIVLSEDVIARYRDLRRADASRSRTVTTSADSSETINMREIVFSACRDNEVAWESGGHGAFTVQIAPLVASAVTGHVTNAQFQVKVETIFGAGAAQHPVLECSSASGQRPLLSSMMA